MLKKRKLPVTDNEPAEEKDSILLRILIILVGVVIITVGLFMFVYFACNVKKVNIKGNNLYEDDAVKRIILNDEYSYNTLYVYLKYKFKEPEKLPFIDKTEVKMDGLNELTIRVYEKKIIGYMYVEATGQFAYIDKDGVVVELSTEVLPDIALIKGIQVKEVALYETIKTDSRSMYKNLLAITLALEKYEIMPEVIWFNSSTDIEIIYGDITVMFGEADNLNDKVVRLAKILPKLSGEKGVLHMEDYSEKNTDIIFEKQP
ncbi:MAG: cell division protein FtsQ/DivIB [Lachnospiraceae bacterium]|jgi:cell division protein FtsQ|nr:cell division protein FtsQ/DivIB [Lachnospiraceae bacterium]MBQ9341003.1 cell division protein FtsQ/DivIB [Lachnospiraceae bacterium]